MNIGALVRQFHIASKTPPERRQLMIHILTHVIHHGIPHPHLFWHFSYSPLHPFHRPHLHLGTRHFRLHF